MNETEAIVRLAIQTAFRSASSIRELNDVPLLSTATQELLSKNSEAVAILGVEPVYTRTLQNCLSLRDRDTINRFQLEL